MDDTPDEIHQLEQLMQAYEAEEGRLKASEDRREQTGAYKRLERRMLSALKQMPREELERFAARQAVDLKRARKWADIQSVRQQALYWWDVVETAQAQQEWTRQVENLKAKPRIHGKLARNNRWAPRDKVKDMVIAKWNERPWRSKAMFAKTVAPEVIAFGRQHGFYLSDLNAERTIRDWVSDYLSGTPTG